MPDTPVIHPLGITVIRSYLLSRPEITAVTNRVSTTMITPFPSLRLTELTSLETVPRRLMRMLVQVDCWAATQPDADRLGRTVLGVLRASGNYMPADGSAVMGETIDLSVRSEPDVTLNPIQPRSVVTGHALISPR